MIRINLITILLAICPCDTAQELKTPISEPIAQSNDPEIKKILERLISTYEKPDQNAVDRDSNSNKVAPPVPGLIAGVQTYDQPLRFGAAGVRKWKSDELIDVNDLVHIGSCTKAMTATLIGRLIDQKKLSFDMTIKEGLPHLTSEIHPDYHKVTLRQLLTHRGGVPRDGFWAAFPNEKIIRRRELIISKALAAKPAAQPNGSFAYSNLGYCIAGLFASHKEGVPWEELIRREVFDVLGMKSAGFGPPGTKGKIDQPWGHLPVGKSLIARQGDNPEALGPAGTVHLTMADWAKFALAHAGCGEIQIVSKKTLDELHKVPPAEDLAAKKHGGDGYAAGWIITERSWANGRVLQHNGSNTMWYATIWVAPETKAVYMAVANAGLHKKITTAVDQAIVGLIGLENKRK